MKPKIALFGDSIFDNQPYVYDGESVIDYLKAVLDDTAAAELHAVDGSVTEQVIEQLKKAPSYISHIFISSGGNDGLAANTLLGGIVPLDTAKKQSKLLKNLSNVKNSFEVLALIQQEFRVVYRKMLTQAMKANVPVTVCTIYDKNPTMQSWQHGALSVFNDVITYEAVKFGASIIDLRAVCEEKDDYSDISPIEPSGQGAAKIAAVIKRVFVEHQGTEGYSRIYS